MKAARDVIFLCRVAVATLGIVAGLTMAGCSSDSAAPSSTSAQGTPSPVAAVDAKGITKGKGKLAGASRRQIHPPNAQGPKDSQ